MISKPTWELPKRVASNLGLETEELKEPTDKLLDVQAVLALFALSVHEGVLKVVDTLWQTLSSLPLTSKRAEKKCYVLGKGFEYIFFH